MLSRLGKDVRRWGVVAVVAVAVVATAGLAVGSHIFADVLDGDFFHDAVEWVFNRGITAGVAPGLYGPNQAVTRGQMAVFLQRLGEAVTPVFLQTEASTGPVDIDASLEFCETDDYTPAFPQQARIDAWVSLEQAAGGNGNMFYQIAERFSTDGGATWQFFDGFNSRAGSHSVDDWSTAVQTSNMPLTVGQTYRFAIQVRRESGTADASSGRCEVQVEITNFNPSTSPLAPELEVGPSDNSLF